MSDQCAYDTDGRFEVRDLQAENRGLREDIDNLLAELQDLKRQLTVVRNRVDHAELAVPA